MRLADRNRSLLVLLLIAAMAGCVAYGGFRLYRFLHYGQLHSLVVAGDTEIAVLEKMGKPDLINVAPEPLWCGKRGSIREYMYGLSVPPEWWVVGFDVSGRVSCTTHLVSP
jgi:hypothetical protein